MELNQYMRKNNLNLDVGYYFDIYAMIQTEYLFILALENLIDRQQQMKYKTTIENYMKHNIHEHFLLDGEPIINCFSDIWGISGIEYKIYTDAFTVHTGAETINLINQHNKQLSAQKQ